MSIYSTMDITRQDAINVIRQKAAEPGFLEGVNELWLDSILFAITDDDDNAKPSRYFNYWIVDGYDFSRRMPSYPDHKKDF